MNASTRSNGKITAHNRQRASRAWRTRSLAVVGALLATLSGGLSASIEVAPSPLFLGSNVPGNLLLTPSVEWPTINSIANLGSYNSASKYTGYFDEAKCYQYQYDGTESNRHFYPTRVVAGHDCSAVAKEWSGNYLNWAATQTIDPFRAALTGGLRVRDTVTETFIEKARHDGQGGTGIYPNRTLSSGMSAATAATSNWGQMLTRINDLGNKMYFTRGDNRPSGSQSIDGSPTVTLYDPTQVNHIHPSGNINGSSSTNDAKIYEVSMRVKVCVPGLLEANCKAYGANYKPEGLIQQYQDRIKYGIFGYLNDHTTNRDGAVLRAQQKFVGPTTYHPTAGEAANPAREWDPATGILYQNPDAADATSTTTLVGSTISNSGVINYLNKFGQMTSKDHKNLDPVSEMYYAAVRYFKKQGNIPEYTNMTGTATEKYQFADGFPVITAWNDPLAFRCQANVILGIGDANSWNDKNLPGSSLTTSEPTKPALVTADTTVNVVTATNKVSLLEGYNPAFSNNPFTGRNNSAFIAGLAYDSHTVDIRPPGPRELSGMQTISTHWVDVREAQLLEPKRRNQYYLAAKYGGFRVPAGYQPYVQTAALPQGLWHAGPLTDVTSANVNPRELRPDNFYEASNANQMVASLTTAFARIASEIRGTGASFGASSTRLQNGTTLYQSSYFSNSWRGDLTAYPLDQYGNLQTAAWSASDQLNSRVWTTRTIYMESGGIVKPFLWANLTAAQQAVLGSDKVVDYLRGERASELPSAVGLRPRTGVLGDIVDSQPVYVGPPNPFLYAGATFSGAASYPAFATAQAARAPIVFVGANDGMMHAFNANTGAEVFGYVPKAAISADLKAFTTPGYEHRYTVDGELTVANVYVGAAWKTILVGTMGRANQPGIFAIDVTNPNSVSKIWDYTSATVPALGNNLGKPIIAQVADGDWRVVLGNGVNSSTGKAQLIMISLSSGAVTNVDLGGSPDNGLAAPTVWNSDTDQFFDRAYAGDLKGGMWRINGLGTVTPTFTKLLAATDGTLAQPITAAPLVAVRPYSTETWLFFGTGRYLGDGDLSNKDVQSWYGIKDTNTLISRSVDLVQRSIIAEAPTVVGGVVGRGISEGTAAELATKKGWYLDLKPPSPGLAEGERMVVPNIFLGLSLVGVTRIPEGADPCSPGGSGYVYQIEPFTGGRLPGSAFDTNADGVVDSQDTVGPDAVPVSAVKLETGGNNVIAVGNRLYGTLDDGSTFTPVPPPTAQSINRVNWREVIGN